MSERKFEKELEDLIRRCAEAKQTEVYYAYRDAIVAQFSAITEAVSEKDKKIEELMQEKNAWHTAEGCPVSGCPAKVLTSSALNAHVLKEIEGFAEKIRQGIEDHIVPSERNGIDIILDEELARLKGKEEIK